jgi:Predicted nucleotide-binding protein containing TIR-like domain
MPNQIIKQSTLAVIKKALCEVYRYHDQLTDLFERHQFTLNPDVEVTNRRQRVSAYLDHQDWDDSKTVRRLLAMLEEVVVLLESTPTGDIGHWGEQMLAALEREGFTWEDSRFSTHSLTRLSMSINDIYKINSLTPEERLAHAGVTLPPRKESPMASGNGEVTRRAVAPPPQGGDTLENRILRALYERAGHPDRSYGSRRLSHHLDVDHSEIEATVGRMVPWGLVERILTEVGGEGFRVSITGFGIYQAELRDLINETDVQARDSAANKMLNIFSEKRHHGQVYLRRQDVILAGGGRESAERAFKQLEDFGLIRVGPGDLGSSMEAYCITDDGLAVVRGDRRIEDFAAYRVIPGSAQPVSSEEVTPSMTTAATEKRIFIGHGGSGDWRILKDFIQDRLGLKWEEFNRESPAGFSAKERLKQMLDSSCFAFLVMTAEDEHPDGTRHARENVIHEIGLFQGRLDFEKAIIIFEDGCEEFSNIHGLQEIRYPKGHIRAVFEEVREVLEREGILKR